MVWFGPKPKRPLMEAETYDPIYLPAVGRDTLSLLTIADVRLKANGKTLEHRAAVATWLDEDLIDVRLILKGKPGSTMVHKLGNPLLWRTIEAAGRPR